MLETDFTDITVYKYKQIIARQIKDRHYLYNDT